MVEDFSKIFWLKILEISKIFWLKILGSRLKKPLVSWFANVSKLIKK